MARVAFLPGASGKRDYWRPVAERLDPRNELHLLAWPGFGDEPPDAKVTSLTGLVDYCVKQLPEPANVVAQSMGGVVALLLALQQPKLVRRLVLCGTSGGIDMSLFDAEDWRETYVREYLPTIEQAPTWFVDDRTDLTDQLRKVQAPTLLLWGAEDKVSPPAVGGYLQKLLPNAWFQTIPGGSHSVAAEKPDEVARRIGSFLGIEVND